MPRSRWLAPAGTGSYIPTMTPVFYAIGDVHGCDRLLSALHARIRDHHAFMFPGRPGHIVHLGDYIDRGPDSLGVIDRLRRGIAGWTTTCLLGNHEAMMFDCLDTDDPGIWSSWLNNGGAATVASLGDPVSAVRDRLSLAASLGPDRIAWLRNLPVFHDAAPYFFVHAGIDPDVPIASQSTDAMLWIRSYQGAMSLTHCTRAAPHPASPPNHQSYQ
jgi:serine/threonine protein phosphatase 1